METQKNRPLRKRALAVTAIAVVAALLLGGTYAWQLIVGDAHLTGEASNETVRNYDITLVEKFDQKANWRVTDAPLQKEVSVVNSGDALNNYYSAYVRITLKEYFEFAEKTELRTTERYMIYDGIRAPFTGEVTAIGAGVPNGGKGRFVMFDNKADALAAYPGHEIVQTGAVISDDGTITQNEKLKDASNGDNVSDNYWFVKTHEEDPNGQYGKFMPVSSTVGTAESIEAYSGGTPGVNWSRRADEDAKVSEKHNVGANGECEYTAVHVMDQKLGSNNWRFSEWVKLNLGETSSDSNLMSLSEFTDPSGNAGKPVAKWIYNDINTATRYRFFIDPYLYWGEFLAPSEVTSNALDTIELAKQPNGPFYYALHVDMEAVSLDELDTNPDWSNIPVAIKDSFVAYAPSVKASDITIEVGDKLTLSQLIASTAADVKISPNVTANNYAYPNTVLDVKAIAAPAGNGIIDIDTANYDLEALAVGDVYVTVILNSGDRARFKVTVVPRVAVTAFTVTATGDATGSKTWGAGTNTINLNVVNTKTGDRTINLAGVVTGRNLPNPALSVWTPDAAKWNVAASADAEDINVVIPQNDTGTMTIIAAAKDDPSKTITVNIKAVANTMLGTAYAWYPNDIVNGVPKYTVESLSVVDYDPANIVVGQTYNGGTVTYKWFVGATPDDKVYAWMIPNGNITPGGPGYDVYIGAKNGVLAPVDAQDQFKEFDGAQTIDVSGLDTSKTTNMSYMFAQCYGVTNYIGLDGFDTSQATDMSGMFYGNPVVSFDLSSWDTSHVTDMSNMFDGCMDMATLNISGWDMSNVASFDSMFYRVGRRLSPDINMTGITIPTGSYSYGNMFDLTGNMNGVIFTVSSQAVKDWLLEFAVPGGSHSGANLVSPTVVGP